MTSAWNVLVRALGWIALPATVAFLSACGSGDDDTRPEIAVIPKSTSHRFWRAVHAGAMAAGDEFGMRIRWKGTLEETDKSGQITILDNIVSDDVDAIALAPLDRNALVAPVRMAARKKIPVAIFDSALEGTAGEDFLTFVASDNREGGRLGGHELARRMGKKGKVVMIRNEAGHASTENREEGFLEAIKQYPEIELLSVNQRAGSVTKSQDTAVNMVDTLRQADGIFTPNESTTEGVMLALRRQKLNGKIRFVGFDSTPLLLEGLERSDLDALVVQDPYQMGYLSVRVLAEAITGKGEKPATEIKTALVVVTRENREAPEIQKLISDL